MARLSAHDDHSLKVEELTHPTTGQLYTGEFVFGRRVMRDQFAIEAEYKRLTEGVIDATDFFGELASAVADLVVLTVKAPEGWDPETADPSEEESYADILKVWRRLRDQEATFRRGVQTRPGAPGQGAGGDAGVLVPDALPADGA